MGPAGAASWLNAAAFEIASIPSARETMRISPNGPGFDSPGRLALGTGIPQSTPAPMGRDSRPLESRPVGASKSFADDPQGWRPGLSNLAPLGLYCREPTRKR